MSLADCVFVNELKRRFSRLDTPLLAFDISRLTKNYLLFRRLLKGAEVFYLVKHNDHPFILGLTRDRGSGFEAASWQEVRGLLELGVEPGKVIFGAPVKAEEHIARAYQEGVETYAYDSREEIEKLSRAAPGCQVYLRIAVPDRGASVFPLSGKFGASLHDAHRLLWAAHDRELRPVGLSFYVGSQCLDPPCLVVGGRRGHPRMGEGHRAGNAAGIPRPGRRNPSPLSRPGAGKGGLQKPLTLALKSNFQKPPRIIVEPGRALAGDAAVMVATVIGKARRQGMDWIYIDAGTYQGLVEAAQEKESFSYLVYAEGKEPLRRYNMGGPTYDSEDVVARESLLPELRCGDRAYILHAGAYSNVCATEFNGFPPPTVRFMCSRVVVCPSAPGSMGRAMRRQWRHGGPRGLMGKRDEDQACYDRESFIEALRDPLYLKFVVLEDGNPRGLDLAANDLERASVAYVNPAFARKRYPRFPFPRSLPMEATG
ncbi:MAG: hypothetical protein ACUVT4_10175 [Actinomycetota bacterium]